MSWMNSPDLCKHVSWPKPPLGEGLWNIAKGRRPFNKLPHGVDFMSALWFLEYYSMKYNCMLFRIIKRETTSGGKGKLHDPRQVQEVQEEAEER